MKSAERKEVVKLVFDIMPSGGVENVRLVETTNDCLVQPAVNSVFLYKYEKSPAGAKNITADVTFMLQD